MSKSAIIAEISEIFYNNHKYFTESTRGRSIEEIKNFFQQFLGHTDFYDKYFTYKTLQYYAEASDILNPLYWPVQFNGMDFCYKLEDAVIGINLKSDMCMILENSTLYTAHIIDGDLVYITNEEEN